MEEDNFERENFFHALFTFFMETELLRNIVSFGLNVLAVCIAWKGLAFCWTYSAKGNILIYFGALMLFLILSIIVACIALRLAVLKVCPKCHENRAIVNHKFVTDREYDDITKKRWVKGANPGEYEQEVERLVKETHVDAIECKYCGYYEEDRPYTVESWENV